MSVGEEVIADCLKKAGYHYKREVSFPGLEGRSGRSLRFDFQVLDKNYAPVCLLEFNGRQHYFPVKKFGSERGLRRQQHNDMKKRTFCLRNGIRLITIPYYDADKLTPEYLTNLIGGERG